MNVPVSTIPDRLYTRQFFEVFAAVILFMTGVALQFHFGQYVQYLGYGVDTLGWILGISMLGTLLIRLHVGRWIDRFGCRPMWLVGTLIVAVSIGSIQFTDDLWVVAVLRAVSTMAMSAVMTTVAVFAALVAPPRRRAESIGTIGLAGFLGMILGPTLGDWIFSDSATGRVAIESILPYRIFFSASAVLSVLAGCVMMLITMPAGVGLTGTGSGLGSSSRRTVSSQLRVVWAHWPGTILFISVIFSMAFCLQSLFLERLAEVRGFKDIKLFFLVYGPTAMLLRIIFRRMPQRVGRSRTLLIGMVLLATGQFSLIGIQSQWELVLPGLLMGAGHCFIWPSMVDLGAEHLPVEFRGTGTALILGAGDVGMLIGFAGLGELIESFGFDAALKALAVTVLMGAVLFAIARHKAVFSWPGHSLVTEPRP